MLSQKADFYSIDALPEPDLSMQRTRREAPSSGDHFTAARR